jgi:hypothetical protein
VEKEVRRLLLVQHQRDFSSKCRDEYSGRSSIFDASLVVAGRNMNYNKSFRY